MTSGNSSSSFQLPEKQNVLKACGELYRLSSLQLEDKKNRTTGGPYATGLRIRELLAIRPLTDGEKGFLERSAALAAAAPRASGSVIV